MPSTKSKQSQGDRFSYYAKTDFKLSKASDLATIEQLFKLPPVNTSGGVYNLTSEDGITLGFGDQRHFIRIIFLLSSAPDEKVELPELWGNYVFYLDEHPIERPATALHYQLLYSPTSDCPSFRAWAAMVMSYLGACFVMPTIPGYDNHDIATVLLSTLRPQLHFKLVRGVAGSGITQAIASVPPYINLLAVLFAPLGQFCTNKEVVQLDSIRVSEGRVVKVGGATHPYDEWVLMLLGDEGVT